MILRKGMDWFMAMAMAMAMLLRVCFDACILRLCMHVCMQVINRSPKYKNKYVHRRTSVTLENLNAQEVNMCCMLGYVINTTSHTPYTIL